MNRREALSTLGKGGTAGLLAATAVLAVQCQPTEAPAAELSPREKVGHLMDKLRQALAACGEGPLRAMIDSDGQSVVLPLAGRPMVGGQRLVGVPARMIRVDDDPFGPVEPIKISSGG